MCVHGVGVWGDMWRSGTSARTHTYPHSRPARRERTARRRNVRTHHPTRGQRHRHKHASTDAACARTFWIIAPIVR